MNNYTNRVTNIIDNLQMPGGKEESKEIIKARFVDEVDYYEKKRNNTKKYYNVFRFIVTTGSILLPALLSIGQMDPAKLPRNFDQISYWSTWSISLMVTISNGFLQLFSLDKDYFSYSLVVEQLKTEGWQFFGLSGKYEEYNTHTIEAYKEFCKAVENIKRKQIEQEFQGKGNKTKKKDGTNKSPLLDFDFDGQMKSFMEKSKNNEMFKPLVDTVNTVSNLENIGDKITGDLKQLPDKDVLKKITDSQELLTNLTATISDLENNVIPGPQTPIKPVVPIDDTNRNTTQ